MVIIPPEDIALLCFIDRISSILELLAFRSKELLANRQQVLADMTLVNNSKLYTTQVSRGQIFKYIVTWKDGNSFRFGILEKQDHDRFLILPDVLLKHDVRTVNNIFIILPTLKIKFVCYQLS